MSDCLILGDGISGLSLALELRQRGYRVTVCGLSMGKPLASWAAGGILSPLEPWSEPAPLMQLARRGEQLYPALVRQLLRDSGIDAEYETSGMLVLEPFDRAAITEWQQRYDSELEWLVAGRWQKLEPRLQPQDLQAALLPAVAQVRNPRLLKALRQSLLAQGVRFLNAASIKLRVAAGRCDGAELDGEHLSAGQVVVAAGAWSSRLLGNCGPALDVTPIRGQMLAFRAAPGLLSHIVLRDRQYLIPRRDGLILAGSTLEQVGFDDDTTGTAALELQAMAAGLLPDLADMTPEHHWSGLRPATADGLPYIGAHPQINGLFLNYGHFRNGILLAPASAELLADIMQGHADSHSAAAFSPARPRS